jgi:hypothetical protein
MSLIKIVNTGDQIDFFIPEGYFPEKDEKISILFSERTRSSAVLKITAPRSILITHDKQKKPE